MAWRMLDGSRVANPLAATPWIARSRRTGDLIVLEILQGFRSDADYQRTKTRLDTLEAFEMLGHSMVPKCATNYRRLRTKGITVRRTADVIIATFCIDHDLPLLFQDRDFMPFVVHLGLTAVAVDT